MAYRKELIRGTLVNTVGLLAKLVYPLLIFILTRLFGAELMGSYFISLAVIELGTGMVTAGWATAATIMVSPHAEHAGTDAQARAQMNATLGRILSYALGTALLFALGVQALAAWLIHRYFTQYLDLLPGIYFLGWAMLPTAFGNVVGAASKGHLTMVWDALIGGARPVLILSTSILTYFVGGELTGLLASYFISIVGVAALSLVPLFRYFDVPQVIRGMRPKWDGRLLHFAVPHGLTHTLTLYITRLDTLMLGALGAAPVSLAWYSTASYLTSNLQQLRIVFSTTLAPVVARHHARGEREEISATLSRTTRWITTLFPLFALTILVLRRDLLGLVSRTYDRGGDTFVLLLLVPPAISCVFGLAGNFITYMGHARVNLLNGLLIGGLNTVLNLLWIPPYGLAGAASATALSMGIVGVLQVIELKQIEGVSIRIRDGLVTYGAAALGLATLALVWDPADLESLGARVGALLAALAVYALALLAFGHPDARAWVRRRFAPGAARGGDATLVGGSEGGEGHGDR